ncbi:MAG: YggS family pyridoxal phosphate-dependent enzyme [Halioglobus sp.]
MSEQTIADNIAKLFERVRLAAQKSQRSESGISVLAVSKTRPCGDLRHAFNNGLSEFGENYLQEALTKIEQLADLPLTWHFIGPIQSNKTRAIAENFDWVHTVDRIKIAQRLSDQRPAHLAPLQICIQVNISQEESKSGVMLESLPSLARQILALPALRLRGLMAIPVATDDKNVQNAAFAKLNTAQIELREFAPGLDTLSMGMSGDMESAIAQGSTLVRIGTDIFGARKK